MQHLSGGVLVGHSSHHVGHNVGAEVKPVAST